MDIPIWLAIIIVIGLLIMSAYASAAEASFLGASKGTLQQLAKAGNKRAQLVRKLRQSLDSVLGSILLFNTLLNVLAAVIAARIFEAFFGDWSEAITAIVMTALTVTYAEITPKYIAITFAEKTACTLAPIVNILVKLLNPITLLTRKIARFSLRLVGIDMDGNDNQSNLEELRGAIDLHHGTDEETATERAMLHSILDLSDVEVDEIMIHRKNVFMIEASLPMDEIVDAAINSPYTRIPFWKDNTDNVIGVLHAKALLRTLKERRGDTTGLTIDRLLTPPWFIPESTTLHEQLQAFRTRKEHFALVVDEYGTLQGIVTLEDIIEEIVGDISDEHDIPLDGVWHRKDGTIVSVGTTTLRDLNRKFNWSLPDEEAATIAGLVLHESRLIPEAGQTFLIHGFHIKILRRVRNQITLVSLSPIQKEPAHDAH